MACCVCVRVETWVGHPAAAHSETKQRSTTTRAGLSMSANTRICNTAHPARMLQARGAFAWQTSLWRVYVLTSTETMRFEGRSRNGPPPFPLLPLPTALDRQRTPPRSPRCCCRCWCCCYYCRCRCRSPPPARNGFHLCFRLRAPASHHTCRTERAQSTHKLGSTKCCQHWRCQDQNLTTKTTTAISRQLVSPQRTKNPSLAQKKDALEAVTRYASASTPRPRAYQWQHTLVNNDMGQGCT